MLSASVRRVQHDFEQLGPERFQELVQALLLPAFPNLACLPTGMPDGGRDGLATVRGGVEGDGLCVFQVKFSRQGKKLDNAEGWVEGHLEDEGEKIEKLIGRGITDYVLITNAPATSHLDAGSFDKVARALSKRFPSIRTQCLWRADLDRRLEERWNLKWSYPELMTGQDLIRALVEGRLSEQAEQRARAVQMFVDRQFRDDRNVRFKQAELQGDLLSMFVDVRVASKSQSEEKSALDRRIAALDPDQEHRDRGESPTCGAADLLLADGGPMAVGRLLVVEGAPGQGKSTLTQYVCQVHRERLLTRGRPRSRSASRRHAPLRLPIRVDLRQLAQWLVGKDVLQRPTAESPSSERTLDGFLAALIAAGAGGVGFDIADLHAVFATSPVFLALDGLDEVVDITDRAELVNEIDAGVSRLQTISEDLQVVVTTRPASFTSVNMLAEPFEYVTLTNLQPDLIDDYAKKWSSSRRLKADEWRELEAVLDAKLHEPHFAELARNPMQLAILLSLMHRKGAALPDQRTALYRSYMENFLDRETEKSESVRKHRDLVLRIHGYVAWTLHSAAESSPGAGKISKEKLEALVEDFLEQRTFQKDLFSDLFEGMFDRVGALVCQKDDLFEFEVQPLREYFAALHLYQTVPYTPPGSSKRGSLPDRLDAMIRKPFWFNVARFYAGCYNVGEIASLIDRLEALAAESVDDRSGLAQSVAGQLLADGTFAQDPRAARRATLLFFSGFGTWHLFDGDARVGLEAAERVALSDESGSVPRPSEELWERVGPGSSQNNEAISSALRAIAPAGSLGAEWVARATRVRAEDLEAWLEFGDEANLIGQVPVDRLLPVIERAGPGKRVGKALVNANLWELADVSAIAERSLLSRVGREQIWFHPTESVHRLNALHIVAWSDLYIRLLPLTGMQSLAVEPSESPLRDPISVAFDALVAFATGMPATGFDAAAWSKFIEVARVEVGELVWIERVALTVAMWGDEPTTSGIDLLERDQPLLGRCLEARAQRRNTEWWAESIQRVKAGTGNVQEVLLLVGAFILMAETPVLSECLDDVADLVARLSEEDAEFVGLVYELTAASGLSGLTRKVRAADISTRTPLDSALLLRPWIDSTEWSKVVSRDLDRSVEEMSHAELREVLRELIRRDAKTVDDWKRVLEVAKPLRDQSLMFVARPTREGGSGMDIPLELAETVLEHSSAYPMPIVGLARTALRRATVSRAPAVAEIASQQDWFTSED